MKDKTKFWIYLGLIIGTILWGLLVYSASAKVGKIKRNPLYISVIQKCANYDSHCGRYFKETLALYDYQVCKKIREIEGLFRSCAEWYDPRELHFVFNALPGWKD